MPTIAASQEMPRTVTVKTLPPKIVVQTPVPAGQPDTNEEVTPQEEVTKPNEQLDPKFAALARKERQLRKMQQDFLAEKNAFKQQQTQGQQDELTTLKQRLLKDPMAVLNEHGVSYDQLTNAILNQPKPEDVKYDKLQADIQALRNEQKKLEESAQQNQQKSYEQAVNQLTNDVKLLVDSDEAFDTIKQLGENGINGVVELIKHTFEEKGTVMDVHEAAAQVEDYLVGEAIKLASFKKVQARLKPAEEPKVPELPQSQKLQQALQQKTLTNAITTSSQPRRLSERERVERAKLAFMGKLTQ